jgi:hypothetical protein
MIHPGREADYSPGYPHAMGVLRDLSGLSAS